MRLLRVIIFLLVAGLVGLFAYAYFGDMGADPTEMRLPVQLDLDMGSGSAPAPVAVEANDAGRADAAKPAAPADPDALD